MKIIITGATGLIGRKLARDLITGGNQVVIVSRNSEKAKSIISNASNYIEWKEGDNSGLVEHINGANAVIHLAGENVLAKRWNENHKKRIYKSRIDSTRKLIDVIEKAAVKPEIFISSSATGYYGTSETEIFDEDSNPGNDFLSKLTVDWEKEANSVTDFGVRYVAIRTGIVLSKDGGALAKMILPFKLFVGGPLGNGKQWFPWIHINDIVGIYKYSLENNNVSGPVNGVAPESLTMKEFCKSLGKIMKRPSLFYVPAVVLRLLYGEGADLLVKGAKVKPKRTQEFGYEFMFDNITAALKDLLLD